ncbi:phosphatidylethanolamine N-methyltransferase [Chelonoidis abingdonii]|uniref:phosphatidylethanolamine N-methyltransferase n=1 Tax=Chelonoidis abingdonii TaxID=106734 RepID=UPI0013F28D13|nr:phosphatidylethanolamine N-methyltransferase [Chelonoidis abingdonii]
MLARGALPSHLDCCGGLSNLDYSKVDSSAMTLLLSYVKLTDSTFAAAVLCIAFNPLFWNVVARWEHKTRVLSRVCGSPYTACYCLGAVILLLNFIRSHWMSAFRLAKMNADMFFLGLGLLLKKGIQGDYFGILKEEKVTSFPFNVMDNPMYWGSTACYLGWSIMHASPAGLLLTAVVAVSYMIAMLYEGPFTEEIYQQKQKVAKKK